jgi:hypothetical protein
VAKSLADPTHRSEIVRRLGSLGPDSRGRWGEMTVGRMVCHLGDVFEAQFAPATRVFPGKLPFRAFPMKQLALYVVPFPRGVKVPRQLFKTEPGPLADDIGRVQRLTAEYPERAGRHGWPGHPYFGPLTAAEWGVFNYKHVDHHLRQFGA